MDAAFARFAGGNLCCTQRMGKEKGRNFIGGEEGALEGHGEASERSLPDGMPLLTLDWGDLYKHARQTG